MIILGIDSGLASCGVAHVRLLPGAEELVRVQVFRSKPSDKKLAVRSADDTGRRARELAAFLELQIAGSRPVALALEAPSWPRNAGCAAKLGVAFGTVFALAELHRLPLVMATPQDVKQATAGSRSASKDEVIQAVETRFPSILWPPQATLWEHAADAVGVVLACLDAEVVRLARRFTEGL